jgi:hypothetical protein
LLMGALKEDKLYEGDLPTIAVEGAPALQTEAGLPRR